MISSCWTTGHTIFNTFEISRYEMGFFPSNCEFLLQDWKGPVSISIFSGDHLETEVILSVPWDWLHLERILGFRVYGRMPWTRLIFRTCYIYDSPMKSGSSLERKEQFHGFWSLLYRWDTWNFRVEEARQLSAFDLKCFQSIQPVRYEHWWNNRITSSRVLCTDSHPLTEVIVPHSLQ